MEDAIGPIIFIVIFGVFVLITIASMAIWIWMLIDCLTKEPSEGNDKLVWALVIIFGQALGAIIYYFVRRPERIKKYGE